MGSCQIYFGYFPVGHLGNGLSAWRNYRYRAPVPLGEIRFQIYTVCKRSILGEYNHPIDQFQ